MLGTRPAFRRLRVYAVDPKTAGALDGVSDNEILIKLPWEEELAPGPVGEYLEVVDFDPASECFYPPVDLNSPFVLGQDGLAPAEGDPRFHQQTIYAVIMTTVWQFEQALGRVVLWSPHLVQQDDGGTQHDFVRRLRVYPHGFRGASAYYSPAKKALVMGYFGGNTMAATGDLVHSTSFTCLSQSVVAHETTHAILEGLHRAVSSPETGTEELAIQEGIADAIGLLQQFATASFITAQLTFTSNLDRNCRILEELAKRLAQPVGIQADLRRSIGTLSRAEQRVGPHLITFQEKAAALVTALFEVFLTISRKRCARLLALAGIRPSERMTLNHSLHNAIASEISKSASHVLGMCIRAIDYCPPVDMAYGDFLRAMVTADADLIADDERGYQVVVVEAFRRSGMYPSGMSAMSPSDLLWQTPKTEIVLSRDVAKQLGFTSNRKEEFEQERARCQLLESIWQRDKAGLEREAMREMGLALGKRVPRTLERSSDKSPRLNVDSFRLARRVGPHGEKLNDWVITVSQRRRGYVDADIQEKQDNGKKQVEPDFILRGGCTLIVDAGSLIVRHCISKDILSEERLAKSRKFVEDRISTTKVQPQRGQPEEPFLALRGISVGELPLRNPNSSAMEKQRQSGP